MKRRLPKKRFDRQTDRLFKTPADKLNEIKKLMGKEYVAEHKEAINLITELTK